ncbi:L-rhamnose/proton symporter RhaT [Polluticaenibacter yanchengensis]|uniref:Rhamnose:proton symporter n=1 Tax=Polluticaenibacter yanchengensis TaxID=3014562 RepID=A0ABT4UG34_9BACT|nr:rhamnose:proton symporter [Chitinophagaceae bacterium LY-5]
MLSPLLTGIGLHAIGAGCASLCYVPQKKVTGWSWQTFWLAQAAVCWLLLPILVAFITIPELMTVIREAPDAAKLNSFLLGMAYGVGGTAFGIAIRYVGFSLTYAISVGISCVLGTLLPPIMAGTFKDQMALDGANIIILGILAGVIGIAACGIAGRLKEKYINKNNPGIKSAFNARIGIPLCLLSGILSAVYGISLAQGQPIAEVAAKYGAGDYQGNVIYIFSNTGAFVTTAIYCIYLHIKNKTFGEYRKVPGFSKSPLALYFLMAVLTGTLWYSQFFFYGLGHVNLENYQFTSWAIHMVMLVIFSTFTGIAFKEWHNAGSPAKKVLILSLAILLLSVFLLTYGNYLGGQAAAH